MQVLLTLHVCELCIQGLDHPCTKNKKNLLFTEYLQTYFFLVIIPKTIQCNNYLHNIYVILGIINNLVMTQNMEEDIHSYM
jgi:hypothetical protein